MKRARKKRYWRLREIRQERDYQIGLLQYANRPYSFRPARLPGVGRVVLTTSRFIKKHNLKIDI
jgi:hypothetical protein